MFYNMIVFYELLVIFFFKQDVTVTLISSLAQLLFGKKIKIIEEENIV